MSKKIMYGDGCKLIKKRENKKLKFLKFIFLLAIFVGGGFILFVNVASLLGYDNFVFFVKYDVNISSKNYYALSFGEFDDLLVAEQSLQGVIAQGGAGYLWKLNNNYNVVAFIYNSTNDANNVMENLNTTKYDLSVKTISTNSIKTNLKDCTKEQIESVNNSINYVVKVIDEIYNLSIKFDKSEVTATFVSNELNNYKGNMLSSLEELKSINSGSSFVLNCKNLLIKTTNDIENIINKILNESNINYLLKYLHCKCVNNYYNFCL